jgi:hypothetical protein
MRLRIAALGFSACLTVGFQAQAQTADFSIHVVENSPAIGGDTITSFAYRIERKTGKTWICIASFFKKDSASTNSQCILVKNEGTEALDPRKGPFTVSMPLAPSIDRFPTYWMINERTGSTFVCTGGNKRTCVESTIKD